MVNGWIGSFEMGKMWSTMSNWICEASMVVRRSVTWSCGVVLVVREGEDGQRRKKRNNNVRGSEPFK